MKPELKPTSTHQKLNPSRKNTEDITNSTHQKLSSPRKPQTNLMSGNSERQASIGLPSDREKRPSLTESIPKKPPNPTQNPTEPMSSRPRVREHGSCGRPGRKSTSDREGKKGEFVGLYWLAPTKIVSPERKNLEEILKWPSGNKRKERRNKTVFSSSPNYKRMSRRTAKVQTPHVDLDRWIISDHNTLSSLGNYTN